MTSLRRFAAALDASRSSSRNALAAQRPGSRCVAIAQSASKIVPVAYVPVQEGLEPPVAEEVSIRFVGHSTFLIPSPKRRHHRHRL